MCPVQGMPLTGCLEAVLVPERVQQLALCVQQFERTLQLISKERAVGLSVVTEAVLVPEQFQHFALGVHSSEGAVHHLPLTARGGVIRSSEVAEQ